MQKFNKVNLIWEEKLKQYEMSAKEQEIQMKQRHQNELDEITIKLNKTLPVKHKPSSEYLNMKAMLQNQIKLKKYSEAHSIQQKINTIEKKEEQKWAKEREAKIFNQQSQLLKKHEAEYNAFLKKVEAGLESLKKQRAIEEESMLKRFTNLKKVLESQQLVEIKQFSKRQGSGSISKSVSKNSGSIKEEKS